MRKIKFLGDPHNGGKRVFAVGDLVFKPRTTFWEWLILSRESRFRSDLDQIYRERGIVSPFQNIPTLNFSRLNGTDVVQRLVFDRRPKLDDLKSDHLRSIGSMIALMFWLGVTDLHRENMAIGIFDGKFIFCPLDIECIFNDLITLNQTHLLGSAKLRDEDSGLFVVRELLAKSSPFFRYQVLQGFIDSIDVLNRLSLAKMLAATDSNFDLTPIRVIVRNTRDYHNWMNTDEKVCFSPEEREQLSRGDIPYFYRVVGKTGIYFSRDNVEVEASLSMQNFELPPVIDLDPKVPPAKIFTSLLSARSLAKWLNLDASGILKNGFSVNIESRIFSLEAINGRLQVS